MDGRLPGRPPMTRTGQRRRHVPESDFDASLSTSNSAAFSSPTSAIHAARASARRSRSQVSPSGQPIPPCMRLSTPYSWSFAGIWYAPNSAPRSHRQLPFREDDAVLVAVEPVARTELHPAERDRHVHLAGAVLGALAGVGAQGLHSEVQLPQRRHVPDRAVDDRAGPAV